MDSLFKDIQKKFSENSLVCNYKKMISYNKSLSFNIDIKAFTAREENGNKLKISSGFYRDEFYSFQTNCCMMKIDLDFNIVDIVSPDLYFLFDFKNNKTKVKFAKSGSYTYEEISSEEDLTRSIEFLNEILSSL